MSMKQISVSEMEFNKSTAKRSGYVYISPEGNISYHNASHMKDHINYAKLRTCQVFSSHHEPSIQFHPEYLTDEELKACEVEMKRRKDAVDKKEHKRHVMRVWRQRKALEKIKKEELEKEEVMSEISDGC